MNRDNTLMLSVCIPTYNHELYIKDALEGALKQKTNFVFEIVVGDDASTDKTVSVIRSYQKRFPKVIRLNLQQKNVGIVKNWISTMKRCKGKYIAILEGDDYWIDNKKLQKQVDFLEKNSDFSICSHNVWIKYQDGSQKATEWLGRTHRQVATIHDILREGSGGATCSLVFRREALLTRLPKWYYSLPGCDWPTQVLCTAKGKMRYFPKPMGVYRRLSTGATGFAHGSREELNAFLGGGLRYCQLFNRHFNYKYDQEIKENLESYFYPILVNLYRKRQNLSMARKYAYKALTGCPPKSFLKIANWLQLLTTFY